MIDKLNIERLNVLLTPMKDQDVNIMFQNNNTGIVGAISTTHFDYDLDELFLTIDNNCTDCEYEFKFPIPDIESIDDSEYEDFTTVIINLKTNTKVFITKN
jgi:hypothetical protein